MRDHFDGISSADFVGIFGGLAVEQNEASGDEFLDAGAGEFGAGVGNEAVEAEASVVRRDGDLNGTCFNHAESLPQKVVAFWLRIVAWAT